MQIVRTSFVLAVPDAERAARFWCDVLGFELQLVLEGWRFVARDLCRVMLGECRDALPPADLGDHSYFGYLEVDDIDGYFAQIASRGASVLSPPADKPWSMREMAVRTPDGHRIMFAQALA
jgi:uncharacterized glyoxalase superfamily protein PhnB